MEGATVSDAPVMKTTRFNIVADSRVDRTLMFPTRRGDAARSARSWRRTVVKVAAILAGLAFHQSELVADESSPVSSQSLIVVVGAGGNPQFDISFYQWSERWEAAAKLARIPVTVIGRHRGEARIEGTDYDRLRTALRESERDTTSELWIVLIGHGTFDRRVARFNLRGPDLSADELLEWLKPVERPTAIINCASASGPFIPILSARNRIVLTATKSGTESNFARFGDHLSRAIHDPSADLDKDNQTSLWEAWLMASRRTAEFYDTDGRLPTEHALLDDNGDRQGVRADQFRGLVAIAKPTDGHPLDGRKAHQWHLVPNADEALLPPEVRAERNALELEIEQLRDRKDDLPAEKYLTQLESLLVKLAELNERRERQAAPVR
jgi:hypothetical protein